MNQFKKKKTFSGCIQIKVGDVCYNATIERDLVLHQQDLVQSWRCNIYLLLSFAVNLRTVF